MKLPSKPQRQDLLLRYKEYALKYPEQYNSNVSDHANINYSGNSSPDCLHDRECDCPREEEDSEEEGGTRGECETSI